MKSDKKNNDHEIAIKIGSKKCRIKIDAKEMNKEFK